MAKLTFKRLPKNCPPDPRDTSALDDVYRVLQGSAPEDFDWKSHHERDEKFPKGACWCRFQGLSLFRDPTVAKKLKNLQHLTHAAKMEFPDSVGAHTGASKSNHITFWIADGHDCSSYVNSVVTM